MIEQGYIRLYRSLLRWEWYGDPNTLRLFLHLLLTVNYEGKRWQGRVVERGQRVCSYSKLSSELGLTIKEIRTALRHLKETGEVAHESGSKFGVFTVINYEKFQDRAPEWADEQAPYRAPEGQSEGSQRAPEGQQCNKAKKDNKAKKASNTPLNPPSGFEEFWTMYPKKLSKAEARKAYDKLNPDGELLGVMLSAIKRQRETDQWRREKGKYIPYPATWINGRRWEDEEEGGPDGSNGGSAGSDQCYGIHL